MIESARGNLHGRYDETFKPVFIDFLKAHKWDYFATFTTKYELTPASARRLMTRYCDKLNAIPMFGDAVHVFWVLEEYKQKEGCHIHALIQAPMFQKHQLWQLWQTVSAGGKKHRRPNYGKNFEEIMQNSLNRAIISAYRDSGGSEEYCAKYITKRMIDWDYFFDGSEGVFVFGQLQGGRFL